ncbi:MAG: hypothetical protein VYB83_04000 [Candidatus Thermoplasmatota archaeon]|nr:hypothetical protein [Candidatus Thermoplasmatota archaeon]
MSNEFPVEIERKFRVLCIPKNLENYIHLRQWYIPSSLVECNSKITLNKLELVSKVENGWQRKIRELINLENTTIRIRLNGKSAILCIKGKINTISRIEFEWELQNYPILERLLSESNWPMVEKHRWEILAEDGCLWELDQFQGLNEGLWLAEIELSDENSDFISPNWVGSEVSQDRRFSSKQLAKTPYIEFNEDRSKPLTKC